MVLLVLVCSHNNLGGVWGWEIVTSPRPSKKFHGCAGIWDMNLPGLLVIRTIHSLPFRICKQNTVASLKWHVSFSFLFFMSCWLLKRKRNIMVYLHTLIFDICEKWTTFFKTKIGTTFSSSPSPCICLLCSSIHKGMSLCLLSFNKWHAQIEISCLLLHPVWSFQSIYFPDSHCYWCMEHCSLLVK